MGAHHPQQRACRPQTALHRNVRSHSYAPMGAPRLLADVQEEDTMIDLKKYLQVRMRIAMERYKMCPSHGNARILRLRAEKLRRIYGGEAVQEVYDLLMEESWD